MKIQIQNYSFDHTAKTITFSDYGSISLENVLLVVNTTRNVVYFTLADGPAATVATNVLTLTATTTGHADADKLAIFYEDHTYVAPANISKVGGTALSVNSGTKDAGTIRVVLATDQPALTNAQPISASALPLPTGAATDSNLTTILGSAGTSPPSLASGASNLLGWLRKIVDVLLAGISVSITGTPSNNVSQWNGNTVDTNSGNKSAGTLRVVFATDQPALTNALKVDGSGVTQPISASALPLPTGAATDSNLTTILGSAGTSPPSLAASASNLLGWQRKIVDVLLAGIGVTVSGTVANNVSQLNGTTTDTNSGNKSAGTLRVVLATDQPALTNSLLVNPSQNSTQTATVSGTGVAIASTDISNYGQISLQVSGTYTGLSVTIDGSNDNANWPISYPVDNVGATTVGNISTGINANSIYQAPRMSKYVRVNVAAIASGSVTLTLVASTGEYFPHWVTTSSTIIGNVASGSGDSGNPVKIGGKAQTAAPAATANANRIDAFFDSSGRLVTTLSNPESMVSGAITSSMTGTTSTSLVAAPASGLRNYITTITVSNAHASVGTDIAIQDGSGGTTIFTIPAAFGYGGAVVTFPTPLKQPTAATALYCANVTTGASTKVSAAGYKAP